MSEDVEKESTLIEYQKEMAKDLQLNRIELEEQQLKLPANKGKWVARYINHKKEIDKLTELLENAIDKIANKTIAESTIGISKIEAKKIAENHELVKKIKKEIKDHQRIVEFLEKHEKILSSMTYDISNILSLIKLEIS